MTSHAVRIRRASFFVLAGLLVQWGSTLHWTPLTFVLFAMFGIPLVLVGVLLYLVAVWKFLREHEAV